MKELKNISKIFLISWKKIISSFTTGTLRNNDLGKKTEKGIIFSLLQLIARKKKNSSL